METKRTICYCASGRCNNLKRVSYFPDDFPCRRFRELVKSGSNPTNCPYYVYDLDRRDIGHNKKSGKGEKRKKKAEQRKINQLKRKS